MYTHAKRLLDITLSLITLAILLPLFIPIVIALRLTAEGEVFYLQNRIGYRNRKFKIWKFATMLKNSPNMLTGSLTLRNDPRVTSVGKFLRMTKINELPQVINVLLGDMSIVGPRPQVTADFEAYSEAIQEVIYNVKPGITGIGSIVFRDEEKLLSVTELPPKEFYRIHIAPYKGELELWYQNHASFSTDLLIIFLTAWQIFFPHSELMFKIFSDLPERPVELTIDGARKAEVASVRV
jgi:lipopolysaccharide/colanic/teichoic acid biosynthesis glycosyltransferase